MTNTLPTSPQPQVTAIRGKVTTNSRNVAALFGKRHDHVLRDIDAIIREAPEATPNFGVCSYQSVRGGRSYRAFDMTKDGFVLLAMGFTGAKALQFKLAYIQRFNELEEELRARPRSAFGGPVVRGKSTEKI